MPIFEIERNGEVFEVEAPDEQRALKAIQQMGSAPAPAAPEPEAVAAPKREEGMILPMSWEEGDDDWQWGMDAGLPGMAKDLAGGVKDFVVDSAKKVKYFGERIRDTATGPGMDEVATTMDNGDMFDKDGKFLGNQFMLGQQDASSSQRVAELFTPVSPAMGTGAGIAAAHGARSAGQQAAQAGQRIGVQVPKGYASDNSITQFASQKLAENPVLGTPMKNARDTAIKQLDDAALATTKGYGVGAPPSAVGAAVRTDVTNTAKKVIPDYVSRHYDAVDKLVNPRVVSPLTATKQAAIKIADERLLSAKTGKSAALNQISEALNRPDGLTYQGIKGLRTQIGELLEDPMKLTAAGIEQGELKRIYGALTDDLANAVRRSSPDGKGLAAWKAANAAAARAAAEREGLEKLLRVGSDEGLVARLGTLASTKSTANMDQLLRARAAVSKETWNEVAAATLNGMGRDVSGNFTPDRFVTAWGRLSPQGKQALFGQDKALLQALEDIATVSTRFKQVGALANHSNTAAAATLTGLAATAMVNPLAALAPLVGANGMALWLSRPAAVKAVAAYSKAAAASAGSRATPTATNALRGRAQILAAVLLKEGIVKEGSVAEVAAQLIRGPNAPAVE